MGLLQEKCPTYLSLIDKADLEILILCMPVETVHYSYEDSICSERMSDTDYDVICIDKTIMLISVAFRCVLPRPFSEVQYQQKQRPFYQHNLCNDYMYQYSKIRLY